MTRNVSSYLLISGNSLLQCMQLPWCWRKFPIVFWSMIQKKLKHTQPMKKYNIWANVWLSFSCIDIESWNYVHNFGAICETMSRGIPMLPVSLLMLRHARGVPSYFIKYSWHFPICLVPTPPPRFSLNIVACSGSLDHIQSCHMKILPQFQTPIYYNTMNDVFFNHLW